jgi:prepilin-type N-terminal cleavage/methylation domain-containing protein
MVFKTFFLKKNRSGFTLVELLIVIAILGLLITGGLASYVSTQKYSRDQKRKLDLEKIKQALEVYRSENGRYPGEWSCDSSIGLGAEPGCNCNDVFTWPGSGTCAQQPTLSGVHNWATHDPNYLASPQYDSPLYTALVPNYIKDLPVDPRNNSRFYYSWELTPGNTYILRARSEVTPNTFIEVRNP